MLIYFSFFILVYIFSLAPQENLLDSFLVPFEGRDKELVIRRPLVVSDSFQETIVSYLYQKLTFYSQTEKLLLVNIDLGIVSLDSVVRRSTISLLEQLKDQENIYFFDVSYGPDCQSIASHIEWEDRETRYFEYRKKKEGLFWDSSDRDYVQGKINDIQPDKVIFFGYHLMDCVYRTIVSWRIVFDNQPIYLIFSLSLGQAYDLSILSNTSGLESYVKYLKSGLLTFFDLDLYERDREDCVCVVDFKGETSRLFTSPKWVVWTLKTEDQIKGLLDCFLFCSDNDFYEGKDKDFLEPCPLKRKDRYKEEVDRDENGMPFLPKLMRIEEESSMKEFMETSLEPIEPSSETESMEMDSIQTDFLGEIQFMEDNRIDDEKNEFQPFQKKNISPIYSILLETSDSFARDLIVTFPPTFTDSLQEVIVSQLYNKLIVCSRMHKVLLIGIDLNEVRQSCVGKASILLLDRLKNEKNIYFLDVSLMEADFLGTYLNWEDKDKRYIQYRKHFYGLLEVESDFDYVKNLMDDIQPDQVIMWGFDINECVYRSIESWFRRFPDSHLDLIFSLSARIYSHVFTFLRRERGKPFLKLLKEGRLNIFDADFYENDEKNVFFKKVGFFLVTSQQVAIKDDEYGINEWFLTSDCSVWRLKSETSLNLIDRKIDSPFFVLKNLSFCASCFA